MKNIKIIISCLISCATYANELLFLNNLKQTLFIDDQIYVKLLSKATNKEPLCSTEYTYNDTPLFRLYPTLKTNIPCLSLGSFPTPIQKLSTLEKIYNIQDLFVKQDSMSGGINNNNTQLFGGNKVRKLEFILADALSHHAKSVLTFGCKGSNHAVATATYAKKYGLRCYLMLCPQPDSTIVQRNLALMHAADAEIVLSANSLTRAHDTITAFMNSKKIHGDYPYFIPTGGSTALGAVGFVNAAFELLMQIKAGFLPEPDYIYVATGSFATTAGLSLGLKAAEIKSQIIAVHIEPEEISGSAIKNINLLFNQTNELLHSRDQSFPLFKNSADNVIVIHDFSGTDYGLCTPEASDAISNAQKYENIILDGTYTGKAFAALASHGKIGILADKIILFWNTFCDYELS